MLLGGMDQWGWKKLGLPQLSLDFFTRPPQFRTSRPTESLELAILLVLSDRLVKLMDYSEGSFQDFLGHCGSVSTVRFAPSGDLLCSSSNTEILMWNVKA